MSSGLEVDGTPLSFDRAEHVTMSAMGTCPASVSVRSGIARCSLRSSILASGRYFRSAGKFKREGLSLEMHSPSTRIPVQILHVAAESDRPAIFSVLHSTTFSARVLYR